MTGSPRYSINWLDVWKAVRGSLIIAGAFLLYLLLTMLLAFLTGENAGQFAAFAPVAIPLLSAALELLRRYLSNYGVQ